MVGPRQTNNLIFYNSAAKVAAFFKEHNASSHTAAVGCRQFSFFDTSA